jgi:hypothetical protein
MRTICYIYTVINPIIVFFGNQNKSRICKCCTRNHRSPKGSRQATLPAEDEGEKEEKNPHGLSTDIDDDVSRFATRFNHSDTNSIKDHKETSIALDSLETIEVDAIMTQINHFQDEIPDNVTQKMIYK